MMVGRKSRNYEKNKARAVGGGNQRGEKVV